MDIFDLFNHTDDPQIAKIKFLSLMALADGEVTPQEAASFAELLTQLSIDTAKLEEAEQYRAFQIADVLPDDDADRRLLVSALAAMMLSDGTCQPEEVDFLKHLAAQMLLTSDDVDRLVDKVIAGSPLDEVWREQARDSYARASVPATEDC